MLLNACAGTVAVPHPVLQTAQELGLLHRARLTADAVDQDRIDSARARSVRVIDRWVATWMPVSYGTASLNTETVGMVIDRVAEFSVTAYATLTGDASDDEVQYAWRRLAELSVAYGDLAFDITAQRRRLPDLVAPQPDRDRRRRG